MKLRAPNVFVLMFAILLLVGALTWIVPAGEYQRVEQTIGSSTREVVDPTSFAQLPESRPQGFWQILQAPFHGFGFNHAYETVGFILIVGGAFGVLNATGAILALLGWLGTALGQRGRYAVIPVVMLVFSLGGAVFGMAEETIAFILITVPLAVRLGFDTTTGVAMPFLGAYAGFGTAFLNPFTLGIAKGIAQQPADEGFWFRLTCWAVVTLLSTAFVLWHAWRVAADSSRSPTPELDGYWRDQLERGDEHHDQLNRRHVLTLLLFGSSMGLLAFGAIRYGWYIPEISALFIGMAVACGIAGGLGGTRLAESFAEGVKDLAPAAVLVAFARGIVWLASEGKIIDPILHAIAELPLFGEDGWGPTVAAQAMFVLHTAVNFFVPSGSGQAALTMPIMTPLADLTEVHRENAILAYQFGDGFTNTLIPTNPVLVGVLGMARLDYSIWLRWILRFQLALFVLGLTLLALSPFSTTG